MNNNSRFVNKKTMILTAIFCCLLWGSAFPSIKTLYEIIPMDNMYQKMMLAGIRFSISGVLVLTFSALVRKQPLKVKKSNIRVVLLVSMVQTFLAYSIYYIGLSNTTGANAAIITSVSIFFGAILSLIFFKDYRMTKNNVLGLVIGLFGIFILNVNFSGGKLLSFNPLGDGLILISSLLIAVAAILVKKTAGKMDVVLLNGYQFLIGGLLMIIVSYASYPHLLNFTPIAWVILLYTAILSAVAFSLWFVLLQYHFVPEVSLYKFTIPIFGSLLSILLLADEHFTITLVVALTFVVFGIIVFNRAKKPLEPR
jgi:drug/metabolite transporter (DMT)-like permease